LLAVELYRRLSSVQVEFCLSVCLSLRRVGRTKLAAAADGADAGRSVSPSVRSAAGPGVSRHSQHCRSGGVTLSSFPTTVYPPDRLSPGNERTTRHAQAAYNSMQWPGDRWLVGRLSSAASIVVIRTTVWRFIFLISWTLMPKLGRFWLILSYLFIYFCGLSRQPDRCLLACCTVSGSSATGTCLLKLLILSGLVKKVQVSNCKFWPKSLTHIFLFFRKPQTHLTQWVIGPPQSAVYLPNGMYIFHRLRSARMWKTTDDRQTTHHTDVRSHILKNVLQ